MEARLARLESDVTHLLLHVTDIKADVRGLRDRLDSGQSSLSQRIDAVHARLSERIDAASSEVSKKIDACYSELNKKIDGTASELSAKIDSLRDQFAAARVWALFLYIALAAVNLGTLARGLGWL